MAYAGTWKAQTLAGASGGQVRYATIKGAKAILSFTGTDVAWVAPKGKTRGKADVFLDGAKVATVDLSSKGTLARQAVFSKGNLDPATPHTLEGRNLGAPGRSRVDVDAFVVLALTRAYAPGTRTYRPMATKWHTLPRRTKTCQRAWAYGIFRW